MLNIRLKQIKRIIQIVFIFLLLTICSCKGGIRTTTPRYKDIYKGTEGLSMDFMENSPPQEVYEEDEFPVIIELENKGTSDINHGYLIFSLEKDYMDIIRWHEKNLDGIVDETKAMFSLKGNSLEREGDKKVVYANVKAKKLEAESEVHTSAVRVISCYDYETKVVEDVCVDTDPYNLKPAKKPCKLKKLKLSSQGAPLAVTEIEQKILSQGDRIIPSYMITIKNKGKGQVYEYGKSYEACSSLNLFSSELRGFFNKVNVKVNLGDKKLRCDKEWLYLDENGEGKIRCKLEEGVSESISTYLTTLNIVLSYGYTQTIAKDVEIKKLK